MKKHIEDSHIPTITNEEREAIAGMEDSEMKELLQNLPESRAWIAILRYTLKRLEVAHIPLRTMDPVKDPTAIARAQGTIGGITDLYSMVFLLNTKQKVTVQEPYEG